MAERDYVAKEMRRNENILKLHTLEQKQTEIMTLFRARFDEITKEIERIRTSRNLDTWSDAKVIS